MEVHATHTPVTQRGGDAARIRSLTNPRVERFPSFPFPLVGGVGGIVSMAAAQRTIDMIRVSIQRDKKVRYEDFLDIIAEAERTGNHIPLIREYTRRRAAAKPPDYSGMSEAERAAEAERRRQNALAEAEGPLGLARARVLDFDPKQWGEYYNRVGLLHETFDHDEESPLGPMRYTDKIYQSEDEYKWKLCDAINIFSVKVASLDVAFPIHVYGTVIARDSIDQKCLYLFHRDRDHPQLISSKDQSLILTGPKRGIVLIDDDYVEINLKIKDHHEQDDRELSKGFISIRGCRSFEKSTVETRSLATRLSTMDVMYAFVTRAVEATIAVEVIRGDFYGEITAYTTSINNNVVLYDSKSASVMTCHSRGVIQLMRAVICVPLEDMLMISFVVGTGANKSKRTIDFTPRVNYYEEDEFHVGDTRIRVKVTWSVMDLWA